jgi:hypothetical protein
MRAGVGRSSTAIALSRASPDVVARISAVDGRYVAPAQPGRPQEIVGLQGLRNQARWHDFTHQTKCSEYSGWGSSWATRARPIAMSAMARSIERLEQLADVSVVLDHVIGILRSGGRPGGCLEAVARPNSAVDDPLVDVVAENRGRRRPAGRGHVAGYVHFHAKLGAGNHAVLNALAADVAGPWADEGMPGTQVRASGRRSDRSNSKNTQYRPGSVWETALVG